MIKIPNSQIFSKNKRIATANSTDYCIPRHDQLKPQYDVDGTRINDIVRDDYKGPQKSVLTTPQSDGNWLVSAQPASVCDAGGRAMENCLQHKLSEMQF